MGGIAGIIRFDKQAIELADTTNVIKLLGHRGKVTSQSIDHGVFLNFGNSIEVNPTAPIYATADADLFSNVTTSHPFTTNYSKSGPAGFDEPNADFAVALWDVQKQTLFCGRDALGVKPLYYVYQPSCFIAFASEIKALLALREVIIKPNEHKFREYLTWIADYVPYSEETFYENIYSVLPGHYLEVTAQRKQTHAYWTINLSKYKGLSRPEDYSTLFRDYFITAIDSRVEGESSIGSHLSGGLDSSSVSCMAQAILTQQHRSPLHTFNIDTELPSADESEYVQAVIDQYPVQHHTVHPVADVLESVLKINTIFDRPEHFIIPSSFHLSVSLEAQQVGCAILLTGHDGDSIITTCFDFLDELFDAQDWENLLLACEQFIAPGDRNLRYVSDDWPRLNDQTKFEKFILYFIGTKLKKQAKAQSLSTFFNTLRSQKKFFGISSTAILAYCFKRIKDKLAHQSLINNALSNEFKQRVPLRSQLSTKELTTTLEAELNQPIRQILNTTNVICNEQLNHIGAYYGHLYSFPFFDKNVMEIGLATPLGVGFDNGRGRGLIRNGLNDVLPPAIVSRLSKANFVEYGNLSAKQLYQSTYDQFSSPNHPIWGVIDRGIFTQIVDFVFNPKMPVVKKTRYNWLLSRIIYLSLWLGSLQDAKLNSEKVDLSNEFEL
ncbi:asparagine synthase [Spirosoma aureum]|uniref:asparagine synthase (glutamine-hydrolyzing) n=1 Tax=Spirosoma aureum TaxID=2692134 RepID=A0A6G9ASM7_9BACT|nr:asparagine synthase-related protein [Spirosoma aureum]QIP15388.1 asparagine synthase [Spirosoma aureum]